MFKSEGESPLGSLKRINVLHYQSKIDPLIACQKLQKMKFFEYVQPYYLPKISSISNDPRLEEQYFLRKISAFEAWDILGNNADTIIVGIIDTGIDIDHEDLKQNIFINYGEVGLDSLGNDKSSNGIDDDGNGYIDDYVGWDLAGSYGQSPDNDPRPGNGHGTHVAGIIGAIINNNIGVAGIVPNVKLLPVKAASDEPFNTYITKGYEGILYAAIMGAKVINCSWGSESGSDLENDVIRAVNSLGACVVAAAGNDGKYSDFAPASLNGVLSVAAVDSNDVKAPFSNYSSRVGVAAPGVKVLSTTPGNTYAAWDGTSMSSPVAAGVVALARQKFPNLSYEQIYELVKRQSDNIDTLNTSFVGLIGAGRVNAFNTLNCNPDTVRSLILSSYEARDVDEDSIFLPSDTIKLFFTFKNVLSDLKDVYVRISNSVPYIDEVLKGDLFIGDIPKFSLIKTQDSLLFSLASDLPFDYLLKIPVNVYDSIGLVARFFIELQVNPSYRTMSYNNLSLTFNSRGNIGFNDYPQNKQGVGFIYKNGPNLLFEGGIVAGYDEYHIYDVVRSSNQNNQRRDFIPDSIFNIHFDKGLNSFVGSCSFSTKPDSLLNSDFKIDCKVIQPVGPSDTNIIFINYKVKNNSGKSLESFYLGLFFDWDLGISGQNDICVYDMDFDFAFVYNANSDSLPFVGIKVLKPKNTNFYAIDNDGRGEDSVGIYDGFTKAEKWMMLSNGIKRKRSRQTDVSMLISSGPVKINRDSIAEFSIALFADKDIFSLRKTAINSLELAYNLNIIKEKPYSKKEPVEISFFPNPSDGDFTLRISFIELQPVEIFVYDKTGRLLSKYSFTENTPWTIEQNLGLKGSASENFFVVVSTPSGQRHYLLSKVK
jgi:hypothetical protein